MPKERNMNRPAEQAPEYLRFEASFRPGTDMTPGQLNDLIAGMQDDLARKPEKKALDLDLERLLKGEVGATELVAKNHEPLAFLAAADHLQQTLSEAGLRLKPDQPMGAQLAEICTQTQLQVLA